MLSFARVHRQSALRRREARGQWPKWPTPARCARRCIKIVGTNLGECVGPKQDPECVGSQTRIVSQSLNGRITLSIPWQTVVLLTHS